MAAIIVDDVEGLYAAVNDPGSANTTFAYGLGFITSRRLPRTGCLGRTAGAWFSSPG